MIYRDRYGNRITEGSKISLSYGIPPTTAIGVIEMRRKRLVFHCENAQPEYCPLMDIDLDDITCEP